MPGVCQLPVEVSSNALGPSAGVPLISLRSCALFDLFPLAQA